MERYAIPGMNCTNIAVVVGGKTNYAHDANSPLTGSYREYAAQQHQKTMIMRRKMHKMIDKELPQYFIDLPRSRQQVTIKGQRYGFTKLSEVCHESIDGSDLSSLNTALSRAEKLSIISCVRFLIELIY